MWRGSWVLTQEIWQDIKRFAGVYVLVVLVVCSAFSVIYFSHLNRQSTSHLERLLTERDELDIELRNLLLEQNSLSEHSEIEQVAKDALEMHRPKPKNEIIIKIQ